MHANIGRQQNSGTSLFSVTKVSFEIAISMPWEDTSSGTKRYNIFYIKTWWDNLGPAWDSYVLHEFILG